MNVIHYFLVTFLIVGRVFGTTVSDVLNNITTNNCYSSISPLFLAIINGPKEDFKYYFLSNYGSEVVLDDKWEALVNQAICEYVRTPELLEEAKATFDLNVFFEFPLLKRIDVVFQKFLENGENDYLSLLDNLALNEFKFEITVLLNSSIFLKEQIFKTSLSRLVDNAKKHFHFADASVMRNLDIIESSSPESLSSASIACSKVKTPSFYRCIECLAGAINSKGSVDEPTVAKRTMWMVRSDHFKLVPVLSEIIHPSNAYCLPDWDQTFIKSLKRLYSELFKKTLFDFPEFEYNWKIGEKESFYTKPCKMRIRSLEFFTAQSGLEETELIHGDVKNLVYKVSCKCRGYHYIFKRFKKTTEFSRELEVSKHLNHPYFVKSLGYTFNEDEFKVEQIETIVYEYIDGMRSDEYAKHATREKLILISAQLFLGLEHLHAIGFVHGDLKPANVMITKYGIVKIIDFGYSFKPPGGRKRVGTPITIAPELYNRVPGDLHEAVDWWAYGATIAIWFGSNRLFNRDHKSGFYPLTYEYRSKQYVEGHVPLEFPEDLRHFLAIFFQPDPECRRLNTLRQLQKIRNHPFFNGIDWSQLEGGIIQN